MTCPLTCPSPLFLQSADIFSLKKVYYSEHQMTQKAKKCILITPDDLRNYSFAIWWDHAEQEVCITPKCNFLEEHG